MWINRQARFDFLINSMFIRIQNLTSVFEKNSKKVLTEVSVGAIISIVESRKCRNWQTSKTKDLVAVRSCGFKSHLPHTESVTLYNNFIQFAEVSELADEQDSGSCERYAREGSSPFFRIEYPGARGCRDFLHGRLNIA